MKQLSVIFSIILATLCSVAYAHPGESLTPYEAPYYGSLMGDSDWEIGEVKFYSEEDRVPYSQLSDLELYMIDGGVDPVSGISYVSWRHQILRTVSEYYEVFGEIPDQLTLAAVDSIDDSYTFDSESFEVMKNPIQGRAAFLNATDFSAGDMYIQTLSKEEKILLSHLDPTFKQKFGLNIDENPQMGGEKTVMPEIDGPVFYYRLYGSSGVLLAGIYYKRNQ